MSHLLRFGAVGLGLLVAGAGQPVSPCDDLWAQRNALYAAAGYCFSNPRGILSFGNEGCRTTNLDELPLSADDRAQVAAIAEKEQRFRCVAERAR